MQESVHAVLEKPPTNFVPTIPNINPRRLRAVTSWKVKKI